MPKTRTIAAGLSVAAALLMLSACQSSARNEYSELDRRVTDLESRADAASTRASQMESAANQCTATCQEVQVRAERAFQQSQTK